VRTFRPQRVAVTDAADAEALKARLGSMAPLILSGRDGLLACAADSGAQLVVSAIVGAAGLEPTLAAIEAGSTWHWPTRRPWSPPATWSWLQWKPEGQPLPGRQ